MKVNLRKNDKNSRPGTTITNNNGSSIEEFRLYIVTLETYFKETLNENLKLKEQLNQFIGKKSPFDLKKIQAKKRRFNKKIFQRKNIFERIRKKNSTKANKSISSK